MQNNEEEIEVKSNVIDLTETGTIGKPVKFDDDFKPDSIEFWMMGGVSSEKKERILLEKCNQFETHYRFFSLEHIVETIFKSSEWQFVKKKEDLENRLGLLPNRKEQIIDVEKLKVYNDIKSWKSLTSGNEPSDDCFLDLEQSKEIFLEYTFPPLGFKNIKEIENYLLSLISYRGNLLYINYLKQLFAPPAPKEIGQGNNEGTYPAIVVMAVSQIINKIEPFLPTDETDFDKKVELTIIAIYDKLGLTVGPGIRNQFNCLNNLTKTHKIKVVELLNSKGYTPQAKEFELKNIFTNH